MQQRRCRDGARGQLRAQCVPPLVREHRLVAHLRGLRALAEVGAGAGAFVMHDHCGRLIQDAQTGGAHREGEVGVFVISRRIARIETAERLEQRARDRDRRAAHVIGVAHIGEPAIVRGFIAAVVPAGTVGEHHATGFLQVAVGIHQSCPDQPDVRVLLERVQQRLQPAGLRHGVVVEEHQELAARQRRTVVAGADEAAVGFPRDDADAVDFRQLRQAVVRRGIVDHDDFERGSRRMRRQRAQAGQGMREMTMYRNHQAGPRCIRGRQRERRERRGFRRIQRLRRHHAAPELQLQPLPAGRQSARAQAGPAAPPQARCARDPETRLGEDGHAVELRRLNSG